MHSPLPHETLGHTPRECGGGGGAGGAGECRSHSPWTAPRVRKKNRSCCNMLKEVTEEEVLEEPVRRKGCLSPAARELQPFFAEESDASSREGSPLREASFAGDENIAPFGWPAIMGPQQPRLLQQSAGPHALWERGKGNRFGTMQRWQSVPVGAEAGPFAAACSSAGDDGGVLQSAASMPSSHEGLAARLGGTAGGWPRTMHDSVGSLPSPSIQQGHHDGSGFTCGAGQGPFSWPPGGCFAAAQSPPPCKPSGTDHFNDKLKEAVDGGDTMAVEDTVRAMIDADVPANVDTLNTLLKCMCRISGDPHDAEDLVAEYCSDGAIEPNESTVRYLSALWMRHEQLSS